MYIYIYNLCSYDTILHRNYNMYVTLDYQLVQDIAHQPYHSLEALTLPESTCNPLKSAKS